jgi:hypothetical protein
MELFGRDKNREKLIEFDDSINEQNLLYGNSEEKDSLCTRIKNIMCCKKKIEILKVIIIEIILCRFLK